MILNHRIYSNEVKIACFGGKAAHKIIKSGGNSFQRHRITDTEVMEFAENAISILKANCPSFFMEQLVRVDIFYDQVRKCLCVNEFESLEAETPGTGNEDISLASKMTAYFSELIENIFDYHMLSLE